MNKEPRGFRLRFAMCLAVLLAYVGSILPMVFPNTWAQRIVPAPLAILARRAFPQNWQLFAPNVSEIDATLVYRCSASKENSPWIDPEHEALQSARTFRLSPQNKLVHAPRMLAAPLARDYVTIASSRCEDPFDVQCTSASGRVWSEPPRKRAMAWASALCGDGPLGHHLEIALKLTDYRKGKTGRTIWVSIGPAEAQPAVGP